MVINNRKAKYDYEFLGEYTAGIKLLGSEVKSIRRGLANLNGGFCYFKDNELYLRGLDVKEHGVGETHDPQRDKQLLLKKRELKKLKKELETKGLTIIPISLYFSKTNFLKVDIVLAKGKREYEKRNTIKDRDLKRESDVNIRT